ncbi:G patch domain-containing protein TGH [Babesia caballi]|uniref:G patch domain-containing protein TGH n=1 Tax=Babesia caballi TaxID=5871 RepID=A0AAV4LQ68_BABCB|nr:G patch domain-containing protein TGH [Babesia caballi]
MSTATFLGTPLSKYEIDDIETDLANKRAREFEKSKGLQYRQNRERIKRNQLTTHYTVDTKEGFVPANFKSSKTNRASYTHQSVGTFTDGEDAEIITKNTLRAIKIDRAGLQRTVAGIMNALGFMGKKRMIGPVNVNAPQTKISTTHEGIGYVFDVEKGAEKVTFVKAKSNGHEPAIRGKINDAFTALKGETDAEKAKGVKGSVEQLSGSGTANTKKLDTPLRHVNDRQFDLSEIQFYYQHLYSLIVKSVEVKEDLVEKIAKGIEFTTESSVDEKVVETGRKVEIYTYDDELLKRFKIKTNNHTDEHCRDVADDKGTGSEAPAPMLPAELFQRIFGK